MDKWMDNGWMGWIDHNSPYVLLRVVYGQNFMEIVRDTQGRRMVLEGRTSPVTMYGGC